MGEGSVISLNGTVSSGRCPGKIQSTTLSISAVNASDGIGFKELIIIEEDVLCL